MTAHPEAAAPADHDAPRRDPAPLVLISSPPSLRRYASEVWAARHFMWTLAQSRLHAANYGTALGFLWYLANPLLTAAVFLLVFGYILRTGRGDGSFPAFLLIGIFSFTYASRVIQTAANSLRQGARLLTSLYFPRSVLPIAAAIQETVAFVPALAVMVVLVLVRGGVPHWTWLLMPASMALQALFGLGVGLLCARLAYRYRDVEQVLPFVLRMWLYLSGIFYGLDLVREQAGELVATLFAANPMFAFIDLNRQLLMEASAGGARWVTAGAWTVVALVAGAMYFRRGEQDYAHG